jgi:hypothetical protein
MLQYDIECSIERVRTGLWRDRENVSFLHQIYKRLPPVSHVLTPLPRWYCIITTLCKLYFFTLYIQQSAWVSGYEQGFAARAAC